MKRAAVALGIVAFAVLATSACASMDGAVSADSERDHDGSRGPGNAAPPTGDASDGPTGVVLVHAARFPSFRMCFGSDHGAPPFPTSEIMPEANVVGVEVGSYVRLDEATLGEEVYLIDERDVRSGDASCSALIQSGGLTKNRGYQVAKVRFADGEESGSRTLGRDAVHVLALTGCGGREFLNSIPPGDAPPQGDDFWRPLCGSDWDSFEGNLEVRVLTLPSDAAAASGAANETAVRLVNLAPAIGDGDRVALTFGDLRAGPMAPLSVGERFAVEAQGVIRFDRDSEAVYASHGFRAAFKIEDTQPARTTEHPLAEVQELSAPTLLPSEFYGRDSSYVLFLVGDPRHEEALPDDAGANPHFNRRLSLHLLAMPLVDPSGDEDEEGDAGVDDGGAPPEAEDAGSAS